VVKYTVLVAVVWLLVAAGEQSSFVRVEHGTLLGMGCSMLVLGLVGGMQHVIERKRRKGALAVSEWEYGSVTSYTGEWEGWIAPDGQMLCTSPSCARITGYSQEELENDPDLFARLIHPEDASKPCCCLTDINPRGGCSVDFRIVARSGEIRWIAHECRPVIGSDGAFLGRRFINHDITERKRAEEELQESRQLLEAVLNSIPVRVFWKNRELVYRGCNTPFARDAGFERPEDIIGLDDHAMSWREQAALYQRDDREVIMSGKAKLLIEEPQTTPSGEQIHLLTSKVPLRDASGAIVGVLGAYQDVTKLKRAEEALNRSEERFRELAELLPETIFETDLQGTLTFVNKSAYGVFGYCEADFNRGQPALDMLIPAERERAQERIRRLLCGEHIGQCEYTALRKNGSTFPVLISSRVILRRGEPVGVRGLVVDITRHKLAEEELRQLSARDEALLASVPDIIAETDCNKVYTWVNKAGLEFFGEDMIGREAAYYFEGEQATYEVVQPLFEGSEKVAYVESWQRRRDGEKRLLAWWYKVRKDADGRIAGSLATARDITDQKLAQEALRQSEARFHELFNSVMEGIGIVDENEVIQYCNPAFVELFEADSEKELIGRSLLEFLPEEYRQRILDGTDARRRGRCDRYELELVTCRGKRRTILASVSPRFDVRKSYAGAFGAMIDITEIRRLQELETRAQRLAAAGQIAGQVAHDFNNMLAPVMAYPDMIRRHLAEGDPSLRYLDAIENSAQMIADLNQQLLTMSRRGHYNLEILNLNKIVEQVLREAAPLPDTLVIEADLAPDLMNIRGGPAQLHRVVMNLIANARDAMRDVGRVVVKTENYYIDEAAVRFGRVPRGEYAKVTVSDNGSGIPNETLQKIFDPFFTTKSTDKKRGSGLGLSVVDAVVKDHDGYLDLSTQVGVGTSFYLYFPISRETMNDESTDDVPHGHERILIVDDDDIQREVSAQLLGSLGYQVGVCESGKKAMEILRSKPFELLILDMIIPNDIDGTEIYRQALQFRPEQKAIIVSGFSESARVAEAQKLGVGAFVKKPLSRRAIARAVRQELDRSPKPAPAS